MCLDQEIIAKDESGAVLSWLVDDLIKSTEQGHILELKEVWLILPSFRSCITTLKEHITMHVADVYDESSS